MGTMKLTLLILFLPFFLYAATLEENLKKNFEACHHWGGEVSGEETKERSEEIDRGVSADCKEAKKNVELAFKANRPPIVSAYVLRVVDCCRHVWARDDKTDWAKRVSSLCGQAESYFKKFSAKVDPDGQSTYLSLCPEQAKKVYGIDPK